MKLKAYKREYINNINRSLVRIIIRCIFAAQRALDFAQNAPLGFVHSKGAFPVYKCQTLK